MCRYIAAKFNLPFEIVSLHQEYGEHQMPQLVVGNPGQEISLVFYRVGSNDFIRRHLGEKRGPIVEIETGRKLGEHNGYWFHTIGQRKGLGLSGGPWYVVKKNVHDNVIYVSKGVRHPGFDSDFAYS